MADSNSFKFSQSVADQLVLSLLELRDALVKTSLELHDYRFNHDAGQRQAAGELAQTWLKKAMASTE
jgi:hypothetical protein